MSEHDALKTLKQHFGFDEFRGDQASVIQSVLHEKRDTLVLWATGRGKSLCYQLPAIMNREQGGVIIVVSPLVALMKNQVDAMNRDIEDEPAVLLGSGQCDKTKDGQVLRGRHCIAYVSPEKLVSYGFMKALSTAHADKTNPMHVVMFAVDEAHCISSWGHHFRPDYANLGQIRQCFGPAVPIMALTATSGPKTQSDIVRTLRLHDPAVFASSPDRSNLAICIRLTASMAESQWSRMFVTLLRMYKAPTSQRTGSVIIYAQSRKMTESLGRWLSTRIPDAIGVRYYHAGLDHDQRNETQKLFLDGSVRVVVATVAFGMGIDKADVRAVMHVGVPKSMDEYTQQIGRAGRDGIRSECHMWYTNADFVKHRVQIDNDAADAHTELQNLQAMQTFVNSSTCRRVSILRHFGDLRSDDYVCRANTGSEACDRCISIDAYDGDVLRNYTPEFNVLKLALTLSTSMSKTQLKNALTNKFNAFARNAATQMTIQRLIQHLPTPHRSTSFLLDLIPPLVFGGYLVEVERECAVGSRKRKRKWIAYSLAPSAPVDAHLEVPQSIRDSEKKMGPVAREAIRRLNIAGIDATRYIPKSELQAGKGPITTIHREWHETLGVLRASGQNAEADQKERCVSKIVTWTCNSPTAGRHLAMHDILRIVSSMPHTASSLQTMGIAHAFSVEIARVLTDMS